MWNTQFSQRIEWNISLPLPTKVRKSQTESKIQLEVYLPTAVTQFCRYNYRITYNMDKFYICNRSW